MKKMKIKRRSEESFSGEFFGETTTFKKKKRTHKKGGFKARRE